MKRRIIAGLLMTVTVLAVAFRVDMPGAKHTPTPAVVSPKSATPSVRGAGEQALDRALSYVRSSGPLLASGPIGQAELLRHLVTPRFAKEQASALGRDVAAIQSRLRGADGQQLSVSRLRWAEFPLTASVVPESSDRAAVRVWSVALFGAPEVEVSRAAWRTFTMTLVRADGAWLVDDVHVTPGPAPTDDGTLAPSSFEDVNRAASRPPVDNRRGGSA